MAFEDWDKYSDGTLAVRSLEAWQAAGTRNAGIVRFQGTGMTADESEDAKVFQLTVSVQQLRALSEVFAKIADEIEAKSVEGE